MKVLNSNSCPLDGHNLIEASAGTGKTYTLQNLFARLIIESSTTLSQILLVTFTDAATSELKGRIREILIQVREYIQDKTSVESDVALRVEGLLGVKTERELEQIYEKVQGALREFDKANIYTIHAFCNFLLSNYAFESGSSFNQTLETDAKGVMEHFAYNYFRSTLYPSKFKSLMAVSYKLELSDLVNFAKNYVNTAKEKLHFDAIEVEKCEEIFEKIDEEATQKRDKLIAFLKLECEVMNKPKKAECAEIVKKLENSSSGEEDYATYFLLLKTYTNMSEKAYDKRKSKPECPSELLSIFEKMASMSLSKNSLLLDFKNYLDATYSEYREEKGFLLFDDLLVKCEKLIRENPLFKETVRGLFNYGMIDEFQDTDGIQYSLFSKIFENKTLFLVGDPKQSIYSFRGGDIHVYSQAKQGVSGDKTYSLATNYRSSEDMVNAVNELFMKVPTPFLDEKILFERVEAHKKTSKFQFNQSSKPLHVTLYTEQKTKPSTINDLVKGSVAQVEALLGSAKLIEGESERDVKFSDITVLVMTNEEGRKIKRALEKRGIPAVLHTEELLFDSVEAKEFLRLLEAIENPRRADKLRGVLISSMINLPFERVLEGENDAEGVEKLALTLNECHTLWLEHSFLEMIEHFNRAFNVLSTLLKGEEGERKLTNYTHLVEILQKLSTQKNFSMNSMISWLSRQIYDKEGRDKEGEAYQLRLETDSETVTIMTAHKSKGLEFNVVICPFLSLDDLKVNSPYFQYTPEGKELYFIDTLTSQEIEMVAENTLLAFAERMRLLYVVLTRAKFATFIHWAKLKSGSVSPIDYLLLRERGNRCGGGEGALGEAIVISHFSEEKNKLFKAFKGGESEDVYEFKTFFLEAVSEIETLKASPLIEVNFFDYALEREGVKHHIQIDEAKITRTHDEFPLSKIDRGYKHVSFSSFTYDLSQEKFSFELEKDIDMQSDEVEEESSSSLQELVGGANTGSCLHKIFEEISFQATSSEIEEVAIRELKGYSLYTENWPVVEQVVEMVQAVLQADLGGFCLKDIPQGERVCEMEFIFPILNQVRRDKLGEFLQKYMQKFGVTHSYLEFKQFVSSGFFNGFMDLLFCYSGKYYIVDWKSNKLKNYTKNSVVTEMQHHQYFFQYLLYCVALHKFLKGSVENYTFHEHFGGVHYIFLRGVKTQDKGIFTDFPTLEEIEQLSEILGGEDV